MESEKIILDIVVDVQKDFITGALANPAAQANVAHLADTAKAHAEAGHWMFFTRDTHPDNYLETREGRHLPVEHCIEGEDGWNLAPELENAMAGTEPAVCRVINKATFGSYMLPSDILDELMAHNKAVTDLEKSLSTATAPTSVSSATRWCCALPSPKRRSRSSPTAAPG